MKKLLNTEWWANIKLSKPQLNKKTEILVRWRARLMDIEKHFKIMREK